MDIKENLAQNLIQYRKALDLTQAELAEKLNYSSENTAKVTKHRCCEKFRSRFNECIKSLF